jgi:hypothetical protein
MGSPAANSTPGTNGQRIFVKKTASAMKSRDAAPSSASGVASGAQWLLILAQPVFHVDFFN